jgi:hypothetical protein
MHADTSPAMQPIRRITARADGFRMQPPTTDGRTNHET